MPDFSSIQAAQKWLEMQPEHRAPYIAKSEYLRRYGEMPTRCAFEVMVRGALWNGDPRAWTMLKMAARRQSNALAYHHPQMFG